MAGARINTRRMHNLREDFFAEGLALSIAGDRDADCWLGSACLLGDVPIDYSVPPSSSPDSHNLDHFHPVADRPDLQDDPTNFRHAHFYCNTSRGRNAPSAGLGDPVPAWW